MPVKEPVSKSNAALGAILFRVCFLCSDCQRHCSIVPCSKIQKCEHIASFAYPKP